MKQDQFDKVIVEDDPAKPAYLWGDYVRNSFELRTGRYGPEARAKRMASYGTVIGPGGTYQLQTSMAMYVGDRYILREASAEVDEGPYWPLLVRAGLGDESEFTSSSDGSLSLFNDMRLEGGAEVSYFQRATATAATGYASESAGYGFGFGGHWLDTVAPPILFSGGPFDGDTSATTKQREYRAWFSKTRNKTVYDHVFGEPGRDNTPARFGCIGPGKLAAVQLTLEQLDSAVFVPTPTEENPLLGYYHGTWKTFIPPKLHLSSDHGQSWSTEDAVFLDPYLVDGPALQTIASVTTYDRATRDGLQLGLLALSARFIYAGDDTSFLIIGPCHVGSGDFATLLFRKIGGGDFENLAWPPDAWTAPGILAVSDDRVLGFGGPFYNNSASFAPGCFYVGVREDDSEKLLVTKDFGETWELVEIPADMSPYDVPLGTVVAENRVLFPAPDFVDDRIRWYRNDDDFAAFERVGGVGARGITSDGIGYGGGYFVYIGDPTGGRHPRRVHPALPGFDEATP